MNPFGFCMDTSIKMNSEEYYEMEEIEYHYVYSYFDMDDDMGSMSLDWVEQYCYYPMIVDDNNMDEDSEIE